MSFSLTPLSVILPVYNGQDYLEAAIRSVLEQTFRDFELIIINDGSSDASDQLARSFDDPRIRYLSQDNRGLAATLNRAIALSTGRYLARMDQDDICRPERLRRQFDFMEANPAVGMLGTAAAIMAGEQRTARMLCHPSDDAALRLGLLFDNYFVHSSVVLRRSVLDRAGLYCEDRSRQPPEDYELWSRIMRHCQMANLPEVLMVYREVAKSMSRTGNNPFLQNVEKISAENIALASGEPVDLPEVMALPALFHGDYVHVPLKFDGNKMKSVLVRAIGSVAASGVTTEAFAGSSRALVRKIRWRQLDYRLGGLPGKIVKGRIGVRTRALVRQFSGKHQS
jgi:glycosyltransferase involved in cell wall biosynthesis